MIVDEQYVLYLGDLVPGVAEKIKDETSGNAQKDSKEPANLQKDGERSFAVDNIQSEAGINSPGYNSVDDIFQDIGANGPFQWLLIPTLLLINVPGVFTNWLTFIATDVHWKCVANSSNTSNSTCAMNSILPATDQRLCNLNRTEWVYTDATKSSLKSFLHLHCGREWLEHLATSSLFVGLAISSLISGSLADKYGRKKLLFIPYAIFLLAGIISAFSSSVEMFALLRSIQGLAVPGTNQIVYMILGEFITSRHRVIITNILLIGQAASMVLLSVLAYFIRDWTVLVLLTTAPFTIALFTFKFVPESIYWLTLKGQQRELISVVKQICLWNKRRLPDETQLKNVMVMDDVKHESQLAHLFKSSEMRIQSAKVLFGWFVLGLLYYGLGMAADDLTGALYRDFIIMRCIEVPCNISVTYLGNRFGRRKTTSTNMLLAGLACIGIPLVPITGSMKIFRSILGIGGCFFVTQAYNLHIVWTLELYGTDLRAKAMGVSNFVSRIGGAAAPWIVKGLKHFDLGAPFFLEGGLGVLSAILMYSLLETKNTSMKSVTERSNIGSCQNQAFDNDSEVSLDEITESSGDFVAFQRRFSKFQFPELADDDNDNESYKRCGKRHSIDIIKDIVIPRR